MQTLKEDTRKRILTASRRLFMKKGFRGTTTRDIAGEAGINLSNLYRYFPSKDDGYVDETMEEILMHDLTEEEVRSVLSDYVRFEVIGWRKMILV